MPGDRDDGCGPALGGACVPFRLRRSASRRVVGTVNLASVLDRCEERAARMSGAWAYLRHARWCGVSMKPCGHDHDELNHEVPTTPGRWVMPFPSCVVAVPDITPRRW